MVKSSRTCGQKQRLGRRSKTFFSDRLKEEALEWHDNYVEEQGNHLNYEDWWKDIIERFQDSFDLATLKKKFYTSKQRPGENCRAFLSRLNSLYDTIEGKVDKLDDLNKTDVEDHLLSKVRKMRTDVKTKVLLQKWILCQKSRPNYI